MLRILAERCRRGLIRVGIQPDETIDAPFVAVVQDTWSGICHGKTNADWLERGFGAETLREWVESRNRQTKPVAWDLIVVAWDDAATERGGYPGYDDPAKNMPLPTDRNRLAVDEILRTGRVGCVGGFSSDLLILQANSAHPAHDGSENSFYDTLKRGEAYAGYHAAPFQEVVAIYHELKAAATPPALRQQQQMNKTIRFPAGWLGSSAASPQLRQWMSDRTQMTVHRHSDFCQVQAWRAGKRPPGACHRGEEDHRLRADTPAHGGRVSKPPANPRSAVAATWSARAVGL